jgi:REP element-mobilizing transposase RayT
MNRLPNEFNDAHTPLGYLITFRAHGTWLHGDERGSIDRFHRTYGTPMLPPSLQRANYERRLRKQQPVNLDSRKRASIESGILETCTIRNWSLWAFNIRTNHVHTVVSADCKPERILSALKANATRSMREAGCWKSDRSPWVYRGSKRYLWTERQLNDAIEYVMHDQGEPLHNPER